MVSATRVPKDIATDTKCSELPQNPKGLRTNHKYSPRKGEDGFHLPAVRLCRHWATGFSVLSSQEHGVHTGAIYLGWSRLIMKGRAFDMSDEVTVEKGIGIRAEGMVWRVETRTQYMLLRRARGRKE